MHLRRFLFWILFTFTLVLIYKNWLSLVLERLFRGTDIQIFNSIAGDKSLKAQGLALPILIYFVWRIFKWSKPERIEDDKIREEMEEINENERIKNKIIEEERIEKERIGKNGYTKLMYLSGKGYLNEINNQLSSSSDDINAQDKGGYTALMYASSSGHLRIVETLLRFGANRELLTKKGNSALFFAKNKKHTEIVSILQANPPKTDNNSPQSNTNYSGESNHPSSMSTEEKIADFERRMNYKAKPLTPEQQEELDTEFHNYAISRRLPE